jgi:hypothetical protein
VLGGDLSASSRPPSADYDTGNLRVERVVDACGLMTYSVSYPDLLPFPKAYWPMPVW